MPYVLSHFWPGATEEQYREQLAKVHSNNGSELPDGQIYHVAGPTDGGFLVVAVWDSEESADRFVENALMPSLGQGGGFTTPPEEHAAKTVNVVSA